MNLISGQLPWSHTLLTVPTYPALQKDASCDCLVIGGGMGGAMISYQLSLSGADTILIDKRAVGGGSTHANTGLLQISNDKSLTSCINTFGEKEGVLFYSLCRKSMQTILNLKDKLDIDPQIIPRSSLLYAAQRRMFLYCRRNARTYRPMDSLRSSGRVKTLRQPSPFQSLLLCILLVMQRQTLSVWSIA